MRACILAILSLLATALAPAAHACSYRAQPKFMFWDKPPEKPAPGEVVLEVEFTGIAYPIVSQKSANEGEFTEAVAFNNSCGEPEAYTVRRVLHGEISSTRIIVFTSDSMIDETWNPWKRRIIVGKPGNFYEVTTTLDSDWKEKAYTTQRFEMRLPDARTPNFLDIVAGRAELIFFALAGLLASGMASVFGLPGLTGAYAWIAPTLLGTILLALIAFFVWRATRHKQSPPHA